jgi:hypothetical protein
MKVEALIVALRTRLRGRDDLAAESDVAAVTV